MRKLNKNGLKLVAKFWAWTLGLIAYGSAVIWFGITDRNIAYYSLLVLPVVIIITGFVYDFGSKEDI